MKRWAEDPGTRAAQMQAWLAAATEGSARGSELLGRNRRKLKWRARPRLSVLRPELRV